MSENWTPLQALEHIITEVDSDPNASASEIIDAIDWEAVRNAYLHGGGAIQ